MDRDQWHPETYERFADLRARPFWDLATLIDPLPDGQAIHDMVDLGCGTGELTTRLAGRLGVGHCLGIDSSAAMLRETRHHASATVEFRPGDISIWPDDGHGGAIGDGVDLVVANASLQWVPDHADVLARWFEALRPGGQLAVQVPANADHPSHTCMVETAHRDPFLSAMDGSPPPDPVAANVLAPGEYAEILHDLGDDDPHVRLQVYPQVMESSRSVVEWVAGTSLRRFLTVLPEELHGPFVDAYAQRLLDRVGDRSPYFYGFKRILLRARNGRGR